jgi:hypothetical protein
MVAFYKNQQLPQRPVLPSRICVLNPGLQNPGFARLCGQKPFKIRKEQRRFLRLSIHVQTFP